MPKHTHNGLTIVTSNDPPPIPIRTFDWSAYVDDFGADDSPYGFGQTEAEALADLIETLEE